MAKKLKFAINRLAIYGDIIVLLIHILNFDDLPEKIC